MGSLCQLRLGTSHGTEANSWFEAYSIYCIMYMYTYIYIDTDIFYMYVYAYTYTYYSSSFVLVFSESSPEIQPQNWIQKSCSDITETTYWELVGGLEHIVFFHILGMSSSQLTNSYFLRGVGIPPTRECRKIEYLKISWLRTRFPESHHFANLASIFWTSPDTFWLNNRSV